MKTKVCLISQLTEDNTIKTEELLNSKITCEKLIDELKIEKAERAKLFVEIDEIKIEFSKKDLFFEVRLLKILFHEYLKKSN